MASEKSRILIIGGTGSIRKAIAKASVRAGHPTFVFVNEGSAASNSDEAEFIEGYIEAAVKTVNGDYDDHEGLVNAFKNVDVVISAVGHDQLADQSKIFRAIRGAPHLMRFLPTEFVPDVVHAVDAAKEIFDKKIQIRRIIEEENIPHTHVVANFTPGYFLSSIGGAGPFITDYFHPSKWEAGPWRPPTGKVVIFGDGNAKVIFNHEEDIATYTIKAIDDPRTLNKTLHIRPADNIYSQNELISLWEEKTGKKVERIHIPEPEFLKQIEEAPKHLRLPLSIHHSAFVRGGHTNFENNPETVVEATELYPDVKYKTVDECLNEFLSK